MQIVSAFLYFFFYFFIISVERWDDGAMVLMSNVKRMKWRPIEATKDMEMGQK